MRLGIVIIAAVLLLAGCASGQADKSSPSPTPASPLIGYWQGHTKDTGDEYLFRVEQDGDTFLVGREGLGAVGGSREGRAPPPASLRRRARRMAGRWTSRLYGLELALDG